MITFYVRLLKKTPHIMRLLRKQKYRKCTGKESSSMNIHIYKHIHTDTYIYTHTYIDISTFLFVSVSFILSYGNVTKEKTY